MIFDYIINILKRENSKSSFLLFNYSKSQELFKYNSHSAFTNTLQITFFMI